MNDNMTVNDNVEWIENKYKVMHMEDTPYYVVSKTYVDEENNVHHFKLFERIKAREKAETICEILNNYQQQEDKILGDEKRYKLQYSEDYESYTIYDEDNVLVEDIIDKSTARELTSLLNRYETEIQNKDKHIDWLVWENKRLEKKCELLYKKNCLFKEEMGSDER